MLARLVVAIVLLLLPTAALSQTEKRVALLIGNQGYAAKVGPLKNPHNDVNLIKASLEQIGFKVTVLKDANYKTMDSALKRYVTEVRRAGREALSFFYYSGHGVANSDTQINYLIPIDVTDTDDNKVWYESFQQNAVIDLLSKQAPNATHYVVFDACRNELNITGLSAKALGADKGFVPINDTSGLLIAYATAPRKTASDVGIGGGPYAKVLAEELVKPGIESVSMFRNVQIRVKEAIGQDPWLSFPSLPPVYFAGRPAAVPAPGTTQPPGAAEVVRVCREVEAMTSLSMLAVLERQYVGTPAADCISARIGELKSAQAAAAKAAEERAKAAAAKRRAEDEERAKAEVEHQRFTLLQQEQERKRAEAGKNRQESTATERASRKTALDLFSNVVERVRDDYVDRPDVSMLINSAINGMLKKFPSPTAAQLAAQRLRGLSPDATSTQDKAMKQLLEVFRDVQDAARNERGSTSEEMAMIEAAIAGMLTALDPHSAYLNQKEYRDMQVRPGEVVRAAPITARADGDVIYLKVYPFSEQTHSDIVKSVDRLKKSIKNVRGYVIDLRGSQGDLLDQAIAMSDDFLEKGAIVLTKGRGLEETQRVNARPGDIAEGKPIIVLINGDSASASEIVAGALQDHKRASIIGTRSFGKGSVQTIIPFGGDASNGAIRLTTARHYSPAGRSISRGIEPDIVVGQEDGLSNAVSSDPAKDIQLQYALKLLRGEPLSPVAPPKER